MPCVKFDSLNKSEVIPDRQHNTLQVWFTNNDRENAQIEIRYENEKILGSLRNDDGDGNENGKKAIGLEKQNNNFARSSRFFVHFSAVVARLQREPAKFTFCRGREQKTTTFRLVFLNFDAVL